MGGKRLDFSHTVNHLSFGNDLMMKQILERYNDKFNYDLDGTSID